MRSLLKLVSRMIVRCDMLEDEELLALASDVYRNGFYDEVILTYLMKYRFGPVDEMFSIWKSAVGFEMDTYDLEEKILQLLMFTTDYRKEGEHVLNPTFAIPKGVDRKRISDPCFLWHFCKRIHHESFCEKLSVECIYAEMDGK